MPLFGMRTCHRPCRRTTYKARVILTNYSLWYITGGESYSAVAKSDKLKDFIKNTRAWAQSSSNQVYIVPLDFGRNLTCAQPVDRYQKTINRLVLGGLYLPAFVLQGISFTELKMASCKAGNLSSWSYYTFRYVRLNRFLSLEPDVLFLFQYPNGEVWFCLIYTFRFFLFSNFVNLKAGINDWD
jgi:hypothetical protein